MSCRRTFFIIVFAAATILVDCGNQPQRSQYRIQVENCGWGKCRFRSFAVAAAPGAYVQQGEGMWTDSDELQERWILRPVKVYGADSSLIQIDRGWLRFKQENLANNTLAMLRAGDTLRLTDWVMDASTVFVISIDTGYELQSFLQDDRIVVVEEVSEIDSLKFKPIPQTTVWSDHGRMNEIFLQYDSARDQWIPNGTSIQYDDMGRMTRKLEVGYGFQSSNTGVLTRFWPSGTKRSRVELQAAVHQGEHIWRDTNGAEIARAVYDSGPPHGTVAEFWDYGQIKFLTAYHNGVLHGTHKYWHYDGSFGGESHFDHGNGVMKQHYADGTPMLEHPYSNGRKHGVMREWYPNAQPSIIEHVDQGVKDGEYINWYPEGTVFRHALFENGRTVFDSVFRKDGSLQNDG